MNLTHIRVGFPILRLEVRVYHATPRAPTAFERVLLNICDRFGKDTTYNNIPLERIFVDVLGVADPAPVVSPTLRELVSLDVLRSRGDVESLDMLILRDLEITDRGRQMLSEDMLPARSQESDEVFFYDPVRKRLLSATESKACRPQQPAMALNAGVFEEVFPEQEIRTQILAGEYSWWNASSRIERIERQSVSVLWRETSAALGVEQKMLRLAFKDAEQTAYVNAMNAEEIHHRFLSSTFGIEQFSADRLLKLPLSDIDDCNSGDMVLMPIPTSLGDFPGDGRFWLIDRTASWTPSPSQANSRQAIVCFDSSREAESIEVKWNEGRNGCLVEVGGDYPFDDVILASDRSIVRGRRIEVKVGQDIVELPVAIRQNIVGDQPAISNALSDVVVALRQRDTEEDAVIPALWQSESVFWRETLDRLKGGSFPLAGKLERLRHLRKRFSELAGALSPDTWDGMVADIVCDSLTTRNSDFDLDTIDELVSAVGQCKLAKADVVDRIVQAVTSRLPLPKELSDFGRMSAVLRKGGAAWRIPFPSRIYTHEMLAAIAKRFPEATLMDHLSNDNAFDSGIRQLAQTASALDRLIGAKGIGGLVDEESYVALLKSPNVDKLSDQAELWRRHYDAFVGAHCEIAPHIPDSALAEINDRIQGILALTRKLVGGLDPQFRAVFVLDTSALLERPEIMENFRPDEYVVVSKRVVEELDDNKREESLRPKVAEATRALQAFPTQQIQFCDGDMSLLAPDYRMKGDNLILSVAVRYRKHRPVLLTNDKNLTLKAKAEDIEAMSVDEFEKRPRQARNTQTARKDANQSQKTASGPFRLRRKP